MNHFEHHIIPNSTTIRQALVLLNGLKDRFLILFVIDEDEKMLGTITDGDIRRAFLSDVSMDDNVTKGIYRHFKFICKKDFTLEQFISYKEQDITLLPVLDEEGKILTIRNLKSLQSLLPLDAVIMAGGDGQRLRPLTEKTPKPLLKVGNKPIIEHNIDRLLKFGIQNIHITLRYLGEQIEEYFGDGSEKEATIRYVKEKDRLGTLGAVTLCEDFENDVVLVMNSDLLTNIDYEDFYKRFIETKADMLIAAVPYAVTVPYAVLETKNHRVNRFVEKPTYTYHSNAGIYLVKKELFEKIDRNKKYDATDFMQLLIEEDKNVQTYLLMEYWLDIGRHDDFEKAQIAIKHIKF